MISKFSLCFVVSALFASTAFGQSAKALKVLSIRLTSVRYEITGLHCALTIKNLSKDTLYLYSDQLFDAWNLRVSYKGSILHTFHPYFEYRASDCDDFFIKKHFLKLLPHEGISQEVRAYGEPYFSQLAQREKYEVYFLYTFDQSVFENRFDVGADFDIQKCLPKVFIGSVRSNSLSFRATQTWGKWRKDE